MTVRKLRWRKDGRRDIPVDEACWQYILDHSVIKKGKIYTRILVDDYEQFRTRLQARIEGKYRWSLEDLLNKDQGITLE